LRVDPDGPFTYGDCMKHTTHIRFVALLLVAVAAAACGGGGEGSTGPGQVARVEVTAPVTSLNVGATTQLTVRYFDNQSSQLAGRTVTYASSAPAVASVSGTGLVTALTAGTTTLTATVDGVNGTLQLQVIRPAVAFIAISPSDPSVRQGETLTLVAQPQAVGGEPLTDRPITWTSANPARATVSAAGLVTGLTPGYVYIRATADSRTDSVNLRVRSLVTPSITQGPTAEMAPGASANITGTNFGATAPDNEVYVNGVKAVVTAATPTSVDFQVPSKSQLPCTATGTAQVMLVANADTAFTTGSLRVATARNLAVGESLLLTTQADLLCNEFEGSGGRYLMTAFNFATNAGVRTSFSLTGHAQPAADVVSAAIVQSEEPAPPSTPIRLVEDPDAKYLRAHAAFMAQDRAMAMQLGAPHLMERQALRHAPGAPTSLALVPPPAVGEISTYRMRRTLNSVTTYDEVEFRVVYSGSKMVILEDASAPLAGTMDGEYVKLGEEFDNVMYDLLLELGDPLVVDSALDDNGRLLALFSPRVNNFTINGISNQVLGFVTLCDFFPRDPETLPDGTVVPACPSSNEGEVFYALVPDPSAGWSISLWRRLMRGTLIHEAKHIVSYAYRYYLEGDVANLEETWLEEATAQIASELWARNMYGRGQGQDIRWDEGPMCDYAPDSGACPDPAEGILHHFSFLYDHYAASETKSILDDPFGSIDPVIYGSSWSFVRYVTDNYSADEPDLLRALVQVQNDHGVTNIADKAGKPFSELLGRWSLASLADNHPAAVLTDPRLQLGSWDTRDLFQNMSRNLRSNGEVIFPLEWPLQVRQVQFGTFSPGKSDVSQLKGGGFIAWELSGTQFGPQALAIRSSLGGAAPALIGMAIVRIQ